MIWENKKTEFSKYFKIHYDNLVKLSASYIFNKNRRCFTHSSNILNNNSIINNIYKKAIIVLYIPKVMVYIKIIQIITNK